MSELLDGLLELDAARTPGTWSTSVDRRVGDWMVGTFAFGPIATELREENARVVVAAVNHLAPLVRVARVADAYWTAAEVTAEARRTGRVRKALHDERVEQALRDVLFTTLKGVLR